ncbi:MAG TPA: hypothetical protein V6D20_06650, partial [Candidatus Obscuribacterales bacterium]
MWTGINSIWPSNFRIPRVRAAFKEPTFGISFFPWKLQLQQYPSGNEKTPQTPSFPSLTYQGLEELFTLGVVEDLL